MPGNTLSGNTLSGGFTDAPTQAATAFRAALQAMARPGTIHRVAGAAPPAPLSTAAGVLLLTLADRTTPVYLAGAADTEAVRGWLAFHCGAPVVAPGDATFAVGRWEDLLPLGRFPIGDPAYPDRSATLIAELPVLTTDGPTLTGPGIEQTATLSLPETEAFRANRALFPLGLDIYFTAGDRIAGLPRSTNVTEAG